MLNVHITDFTRICVLAEKEYFANNGQSNLFTALIVKYQEYFKNFEDKEARKQYIADLLKDNQAVIYYTIQDTDYLSPYDFEELVAALYCRMGYEASATKKSGDQGVDIIAIKAGRRTAIQAKRYPNSTVGNSAIQEVVAGMKLYNATSAVVVTNSTFTSSAVQLAEVNNVELIDRAKLDQLLRKYPVRKG